MNTTIRTIAQLQAATVSTYIYDLILAVAFVLLLLIIANMIQWQPGKVDNSGSKRKTCFFVLLACSLLAPVVLDYVLFYSNIAVAQFKNTYMMHMGLAAVLTAVVFFLISLVLIKTQRRDTKLASIFPKEN